MSPQPQVPYGAWIILVFSFVAVRVAEVVRDWPESRYDPIALPLLALAVWSVSALFGRSALALSADGVWLGPFRPRLLAWDLIDPTRLHPPHRRDRALWIPLATAGPLPEPVADVPRGDSAPPWTPLHGRGLDYDANVNALVASEFAATRTAPSRADVDRSRWVEVDLTKVTTDSALIAHALRRYVADPAARAAIGTQAGYAELVDGVPTLVDDPVGR